MGSKQFDVVVVGAGIHGAAVAHQALEWGLSVLLLERYGGPALATSRRSSKLIHGGLRYLESLQLGLVRECLQDRQRLLRDYPGLVQMQPFYIPIYKASARTRLQLRAGLSLYSLLGGFGHYSRFKTVPKRDWPQLDGLKSEDLLAVFEYWDGQADDLKLTTQLLDESRDRGACVHFNAELVSCEDDGSRLQVSYTLGTGDHTDQPSKNTKQTVTAQYLVNATGPWVNETLARCSPVIPGLAIELVQGTHIELAGKLERGIYYLEVPQDQRAVFAMPWYDRILLGTTENPYQGDPAKSAPTEAELDYLLGVYNHYFSSRPVTPQDIIAAWSGLRVLPVGEGRPFKRSRGVILHLNRKQNPSVISIYGGKLTNHYSTALKVLKHIR